MKKKTVAIYQNTFGGGGRIKVIAAITYLLNERGIIPDWISFRNTVTESMMEQIISKPLKANFITLKYFVKGMSEYKYIKINRIIENLSKDYNLVINSNNTISGLKNDNNYIHYFHFPREARLIQKYNNETIHNHLFTQLFRRMYLQRLPVSDLKGIFLANSKFTKGAMDLVYPLNNVQVEVLYPPVVRPVIAKLDIGKDRNKVVSLGRFSPHKNQLVQLQIAKQVPGIQFDIIGFVGNRKAKKYYDLCNDYIRKNGLKNVYLHKNISYQKVLEYLGKANIFIHSMSDEPFGIATVEAMFCNCIPLVHCSGGQKEIVKETKFMFTTIDEAVNKLQYVLSLSDLEYKSILESLSSRAELYSLDVFLDKFALIINEYIDRRGGIE